MNLFPFHISKQTCNDIDSNLDLPITCIDAIKDLFKWAIRTSLIRNGYNADKDIKIEIEVKNLKRLEAKAITYKEDKEEQINIRALGNQILIKNEKGIEEEILIYRPQLF
jgi:hypothetical protein